MSLPEYLLIAKGNILVKKLGRYHLDQVIKINTTKLFINFMLFFYYNKKGSTQPVNMTY